MNIIIPIIIVAVIVGLVSKRITAMSWFAMSIAILAVIARFYAKN